jgi:hypothetical protein
MSLRAESAAKPRVRERLRIQSAKKAQELGLKLELPQDYQ